MASHPLQKLLPRRDKHYLLDKKYYISPSDVLGQGSYGVVYQCFLYRDNFGRSKKKKFLACKVQKMESEEDRKDVEEEVKILKKMDNKNVIKLWDYYDFG